MLKYYLTTFFISAAVAIILTPIIRKVALELGIVDSSSQFNPTLIISTIIEII